MGFISIFSTPPLRKHSMLPRTAGSNLSVRCYLIEGFTFRHGQEAILDLQDLCHPQNHVLYHYLWAYYRLHFLCRRDEPAKQLDLWAFCLKSSQLLSR